MGVGPPLGQGRSGNDGLALLVVLLLVGVGFAVHFSWVIARSFLSSGSSGSGWDVGRARAGTTSTDGELTRLAVLVGAASTRLLPCLLTAGHREVQVTGDLGMQTAAPNWQSVVPVTRSRICSQIELSCALRARSNGHDQSFAVTSGHFPKAKSGLLS